MIKTFEEFVNEAVSPHIPEIVYTPEEYKTAYDIISEYYDPVFLHLLHVYMM